MNKGRLNQDLGEAVRFISWNVKGVNGPVKRARIFAHLKFLKCEIAFLQETHLLVKAQIKENMGGSIISFRIYS